jgi:hypothetical protein
MSDSTEGQGSAPVAEPAETAPAETAPVETAAVETAPFTVSQDSVNSVLATVSHGYLATRLEAAVEAGEYPGVDGAFLKEAISRLRFWESSMGPKELIKAADPSDGFLAGVEAAARFIEDGARGWVRHGAQQIGALVRDHVKPEPPTS